MYIHCVLVYRYGEKYQLSAIILFCGTVLLLITAADLNAIYSKGCLGSNGLMYTEPLNNWPSAFIEKHKHHSDWQLSVINKGPLGKLQGRTAGVKMGQPSATILIWASNLLVGG